MVQIFNKPEIDFILNNFDKYPIYDKALMKLYFFYYCAAWKAPNEHTEIRSGHYSFII